MLTSPAVEGTQKTAGALMGWTLFLTALIFAGLQCRHPYFTMTDDNLSAAYPTLCEVGERLQKGEVPWYTDYLFGGHYDLLRDAQYFGWHPLYLLTSLLVGTPFQLCILDIISFFLYLLAAAGFVSLACSLREEGLHKAGDGWIIFCALSFTFTMMSLTISASWFTFENNSGALPWLALGILQKQWRRGVGLVTFFSIHQILGGQALPLISNSIFLSLFAVGISWWRGSFHPLGFWFGGYALAVILLLPLLIPVTEGFFSCYRSSGTYLSDMQSNNIPLGLFSCSFFLGTALSLSHVPQDGTVNGIYIFSLGSCAAAWCLVPALLSRVPWRFLEKLTFVLAMVAVILIARPDFISKAMLHLPVLRSMRWPFRELIQFQFFFHLFLLLRPMTCLPRVRFLTALAGTAAFVVPMLLYPVTPTFNDMPYDRQVILSGQFEPYWAKVRTFFKPGDRYVVLIPVFPDQADSLTRPFSLMGGYNYAMLAHVVCGSGYSQTTPRDQVYLKTPIFSPWGAYQIKQRDALLRECPSLKFVTLESVKPLKVTLSSRDGPTIDLTPYIPPRTNHW